ncbi:hypothetical protein MBRA_00077 [Methylobacterium brachiatum]|nr:hypothetical protein MBRA_00077 [Methylobacterium brachiatum]
MGALTQIKAALGRPRAQGGMSRPRTIRPRRTGARPAPAALGLAREAARAGLRRIHGLHALRSAAALGGAVSLARLTGALIETGELDGPALGLAMACALAGAWLAAAIEGAARCWRRRSAQG